MADDDLLSMLAAALADGKPVDWTAAEGRAATDAERGAIRQLRELGEVAGFQRHDAPAMLLGPPGAAEASVRTAACAGGVSRTWGPVEIRERVGAGSFGDVYRAWDRRLDREVALKVVRDVPPRDDAFAASVIEEGRLLARVRHSNVATVYGAERIDDEVGIWMEFIEGETLAQLVQHRGPFGAREAALIGLDVCRALAAVHAAGLLHRDVKAQNVMRESGGRIVLTDFGTGREALEAAPGGHHDISGTPLYLAPEIFDGSPASTRSDLYSLGILLYHLVTGSYPVRGTSLAEIREAHAAGRVRRLLDVRPNLPRDFVRVVERALAADPAGRFESAGEMEAALAATTLGSAEALLSPAPRQPGGAAARGLSRTRWRARVWAFALFLLACAVGGALFWRLTPPRPMLQLQQRDWVLVAAFENRTGDPAFDGTVEAALEREISNSRFLSVVPRLRADDTLRLMKKSVGTPLDAGLAREVCVRDGGIRAFVAGRVEKVGTVYAFSAEIFEPSEGRAVGGLSERADDARDVLAAIQRLAVNVRAMLGERREQIQVAAPGGEPVTTPSLEAWKLYSDSVRAAGSGNWEASVELARIAVQKDRTFASAHAWLAWGLRYQRQFGEAVREADIATGLAGAASERERFFIAALGSVIHQTALEQERSAAVAKGQPPPSDAAERIRRYAEEGAAALEALLRIQPDDYWASVVLGMLDGMLDRLDDARTMVARVADLRPTDARANLDAARWMFWHGCDLAEAQRFLTRARAAGGAELSVRNAAWLDLETVFEKWVAGNAEAVAASVDAVRRSGETRREYLEILRELDEGVGRIARVEADVAPPAGGVFGRAILADGRGDRAAARAWARQLPAPSRASIPPWQTWILRRTGLQAHAERIVHVWESTGQDLDSPGYLWARGEVDLGRRRLEDAIAALRIATARLVPSMSVMSAESLAEALARAGKTDEAIRVLEDGTRSQTWCYSGFNAMLSWIRCRGALLALYRRAGRTDDAQRVESDLRRRLAVADRDFARTVIGGEEGGIAIARPR